MSEHHAERRLIYGNLDTTYVNLAALIRYLQARLFVGFIHVELDDYSADVFFERGAPQPLVRERDHLTKREAEGAAAFERLIVRAYEPGGLIDVYEDVSQAKAQTGAGTEALVEQPTPPAPTVPPAPTHQSRTAHITIATAPAQPEAAQPEVNNLVGELIAAVERAASNFRVDFAVLFRLARLSVADDYPFLDPSTKGFHYAAGHVRVQMTANDNILFSGVIELLVRTIERLTTRLPEEQQIEWRTTLDRELGDVARRRASIIAYYNLAAELNRLKGK